MGDAADPSEPVEVRFTGADHLDIVGDRRGDPSASVVVLLHGGGQTRHSWAGTAAVLARAGWCVVSLDARGHGESDWSPDADYRLNRFAADVGAVVDQLGVRPVVVGASLGGLTGLFLEGNVRPGSMRALVLVDVIPRMEKAGADRIADFMAEHMQEGFASLEEAADAIAAYNPHRRRPSDLSGLRKNLRLADDGRWYWHWDPRFISRGADGEGRAPSEITDEELLMAAARAVRVPMLLVRGRMSDVVSEAGARDFVAELPHVRFVDVSGAGHMVAGDRNDAFTDAVVGFLRDLPPA